MPQSFACLFACLLVSLGALYAQEAPPQEPSPSPTPEDQTTGDKSAFLRTWIMLPPEVAAQIVGDEPKLKDNLSLVYNDADGKTQSIASGLSPYSTSGYAELSPAKREIRLVRAIGNSSEELAKAKIELTSGKFFTAVVLKVNGTYHISIIDDTPKPPKPTEPGMPPPPPPKQIIFYNFIPGNPIALSSREGGFTRTVAQNAPQLATNLPGKIFTVQMPIKSKRRELISDVEVDLQVNDNLSFLIVPDLYGRTSARVLVSGKLE